MNLIEYLKTKVINEESISREEAILLRQAELEELCSAADEVRNFYCNDTFDLCTIINGKSGKCTEDCKYCAQSSFYNANVETYSFLDEDTLIRRAVYDKNRGALRFSIVTSGKRLEDKDIEMACECIHKIKEEVDIQICASFGLLDQSGFEKLKEAGVSRIHNNLETSRNYFPNICTTHTYDEKIVSIKAAQKAGLSVCSGGIMGLGERMIDRIDMFLEIRELGIKSIPINILNPIPGTPFENNQKLSYDEIRRIIATARFINPKSYIRIAGGRGLLNDKGKACFQSGANAAISGDMLTTSGISINSDIEMLKELGYKVHIE